MTSQIIGMQGGSTRRSSARSVIGMSAVLFGTALLAFGCGSDSKSIKLELTSPTDGQVLSLADDDKDIDKTGLQFDVAGKSQGIAQGTSINLFIDDQKQAVTAKIDAKDEVHVPGVTLPPGTHTMYLETSTGSTSSNHDQKYTLKALVITAPNNGDTITADKDEDKNTADVQISVAVDTYAIDVSQKVELLVDGKSAATKAPSAGQKPDDKGSVTFSGVTLMFGKHTLQAQVTDGATKILSGEVKIEVQESCAAVTFLTPAPAAAGQTTSLGGEGQCPADPTKNPFTTRVEISTDAGEGRPVQLYVNGQPSGDAVKVAGARAVFDGVPLSNLSGANKLEVQVTDSAGHTCRSAFPNDIVIDCAGPDCTIKSPTAIPYIDTSGTTLYLNHALTAAGGTGFDIQVASSADVIGQDIQLIVDGNSRKALKVAAAADGKGSSALFAAVALSEGAHTVQAVCTDATGNPSATEEFSWIVDVTPCGVDVTDPPAGAVLVPGDDTDTASAGTQIVASSTVTGTDCSAQRAKVCDPSVGITATDFSAYDGTSPLLSTITLDETTVDQNLCVDVQDRAGNIGHNDVAVHYQHQAPTLQIESPADGTKYNAAGGGAYTQTADPLSTACSANVMVLCAELGATVDLRHAVADATPLVSASCAQSLGSDPALPTGFAGRAHFDKVSFLPGTSQMGTLVATQTVTGSSGKPLVASTDVITLQGDCQPPTIVMSPDLCTGGALGAPTGSAHVTSNITIHDGTVDVDQVMLHVTNAGGPIDSTATKANDSSGNAAFTAVDLGTSAGTVSPATIEVTVTDAFANTATRSCNVDIASDLPTLTLTSPTTAPFGIGGGCNSGMAGVYGVPLSATADQTTGRSAMVTVGSFSKSYGPPLSSTTITDCVPVAEGSNTLQLELTSTGTTASVSDSATFTVDTLSITAPTSNPVIGQGGTCSTGTGGETGVPVSASADPVHNGRNVSIQAGSNRTVMTSVSAGAITACIPASQGSNTVTVSILDASSATLATEASMFTLITSSPTTGIPITTAAIPTDGPTYRTDKVTLTWSAPSMDFNGQLLSYQLRCSNTALDVGTATAPQQATWWMQADPVTLPNGFVPPTATVDLGFRIGQARYCELRGADALNQLTPLVNTVKVDYPFRKHLVSPTSTGQAVGSYLAAVGDVNGDGVDDVLVGGQGEAELIFGSDSGWSTSAPDVVFQGDAASSFGGAVAGIGDFNGDGRSDFVIGYPGWVNPSGMGSPAVDHGRVFVFYGRAATDSWPAVVDVRGAACAADLCFETTHQDYFGAAVASAGDFNHDNAPDLAIGSAYTPDYSGNGAVYVVLGKAYEQGMTKPGGSKFWKISVDIHGGSPLQGFEFVSDGIKAEDLGSAILGVGNFDGLPGDDLVVSALWWNMVTDRIFFLSGRDYDLTTGTGLTSLDMTAFGFVTSGTPSGQPMIVSPNQGTFGARMAVLGNVYNVPGGAMSGAVDIEIYDAPSSHAWIYPGDNRFAPSDRIALSHGGTALGISTADGYFAGLAQNVGDLDGDGRPELCVGSDSAPSGSPGDVTLWYSDIVQTKTVSNSLSYADSSQIGPPTGTGTRARAVQYVGDVNGDGSLDLVVGDPVVNSRQGEVTILY
jgi:hypothetical protein